MKKASKKRNSAKEQSSQLKLLSSFSDESFESIHWAVALVVLGFIVFWPTFGADFFWDDKLGILKRPAVTELSGFLKAWTPFQNNEYWPVSYNVFWLLWRIAPNNPFVFHFAVLASHILCSLMLWRVFRSLRVPLAYFGALLFLVHPVNAETASWCRQLETTLSLLGGLCSVYFWVRFLNKRKKTDAAKSLGCFILGALSKTTIIGLPVILLLLTWYQGFFENQLKSLMGFSLRQLWSNPVWKRLFPFWLAALVIGLLAMLHNDFKELAPEEAIRTDGFLGRLQIAGRALWFYLNKAVVPVDLNFMYPRWSSDPKRIPDWIPTLGYGAILTTLWFFRKTPLCRFVFLLLCLYSIALFPALGFVDIYFMRYSLVADHWQYQAIPMVICAFCVALYFILEQLEGRKKAAVVNSDWVGFIAICWLGLWGYQSYGVAKLFQREETVYLDTIRKNPAAWMAYNNLGNIYTSQNRFEIARTFFKKSYELKPDHIMAMVNEGKVLIKMNQLPEAIEVFSRASALSPRNPSIFSEWCAAYAFQERYDFAEEKCKKAIELSSNDKNDTYLNSYLNLSFIYQKTQRPAEAVQVLQKLSRTFPQELSIQKRLSSALQEEGESKQTPIIDQSSGIQKIAEP